MSDGTQIPVAATNSGTTDMIVASVSPQAPAPAAYASAVASRRTPPRRQANRLAARFGGIAARPARVAMAL